ncbi:MAG: toll/interleukin-1 receptor domain-containing protein [Akkermansiaceae bacterium]|nr:toll/interleukin-1 receptor domain-containing protein [Akkermansiaceae bacterium]
MPNIFISYRKREVTASNFVHRFAEKLAERYGQKNVFLDDEQLPIGEDFRIGLIRAVEASNVVFVIIGPGWVQRLHELDGQEDYVRLEIRTALRSELKPKIAPILIGGVSMPKGEDLPEDIRDFANRHGTAMDTKTLFHETFEKLTERLDLPQVAKDAPRSRTSLGVAAFLLFILIAVVAFVGVKFDLSHLYGGLFRDGASPTGGSNQNAESDRGEKPEEIEEVEPEILEPAKPDDVMTISFGAVPVDFQKLPSETVSLRFYKEDPRVPFNKDIKFEGDVWISKVPVSEKLWEEVMRGDGDRGRNKPKTEVSHSELFETGGFFRRINQLASAGSGSIFTLPTEYEWQRLASMPISIREEKGIVIDTPAFVEWCEDRFNRGMSESPQVNRRDEKRGIQILLRGRDDDNTPGFRGSQFPDGKSVSLGFRLVIAPL